MKKFFALLTVAFVLFGVVLELSYQKRLARLPALVEGIDATPIGLSRFGTVPDFSLIDQSGGGVKLADLKGKVWLADFIYTTCPDSCPMLSSRLADWQQDIMACGDVRMVSFSVDPEHDTPEVLQGYAKRFKATDHWLFLTGNKEQVTSIARQGFLLGFENAPGTSGNTAGITHSTKIALVDKNGVVRRFYDGIGPEERTQLLADLKTLLHESPVSP